MPNVKVAGFEVSVNFSRLPIDLDKLELLTAAINGHQHRLLQEMEDCLKQLYPDYVVEVVTDVSSDVSNSGWASDFSAEFKIISPALG